MREKLFSLTAKDFDWAFYRGSGKGGQHRNKTDSAVRCTYKASGAVATAQDERSQRRNKVMAFKRVAETDLFREWLKIECAKRLGANMESEEGLIKRINEEIEDRSMTTIEYL